MEYKKAQTPSIQKGIVEKVTGHAKYVDDLDAPNALHGKFVSLPCPRAKIKQIDIQESLSVTGVVDVFTAEDFPEGVPRFGPFVMDQPVLAAGETKFQGQPVALVVAENERQALLGADRVKVQYEELPAAINISQTLAEDAPLVHDPGSRHDSPWKDTNIMDQWTVGWGDISGKESLCACVVENTYKAPFVHHFAMETFGCIAVPENGGVTLLTGIQHPFLAQRIIAEMLELPRSKVRIQTVDMGGAFGGKGYPKIEPIAASLALSLKRPLKIILTPEEGFMIAHRESPHIRVRTGFDKSGAVLFQDILADFLIGAYADISPRVVAKGARLAAGPYWCPNVNIVARAIYTHTAPATAFRGFGSTHYSWAVEGQMDLAARKLGMDPVALRLRNIPSKGNTIIPNDTPVDGDWSEALKKTAEAMQWNAPRKPGRGRSIAIGVKPCVSALDSHARVALRADNRATVYMGTTEMGQGARTTMALIVGKRLNVPVEHVSVISGDTGLVPFDTITASSRSTVTMGNALLAACDHLENQLKDIAADFYKITPGEIQASEGRITAQGNDVSFSDMLAKSARNEVVGEGVFECKKDPAHPLGGPFPFYEFVVTGVELHIAPETGDIVVDKLVNVTDAGKIINPCRALGVDEGGAVMGLGVSLSEQLLFDDFGHLLNAGSLDYRIPRAVNIPEEFVTIFQENQDGPGPFGAKGMGEGAILAIAPAVCGAVYDATGIYISEIPLTPEKIWKTLQSQEHSPSTD